MKSNIAVGVIKPIGVSVVSYLDLNLNNKGTNNCVPNIGPGLETGDVVSGWKDANTYWIAAIYNGGDPSDRSNYTPLHETVMDYVCGVPQAPTTPTTPLPGTPPTTGGTTTLPILDFYYEGFWENGDVLHHPEINAWVDYLDEFGVQYRFMIGGLENGCQLLQASSIVDTNGCVTCVRTVGGTSGNPTTTGFKISNSTTISKCAGAIPEVYPNQVYVGRLPIMVGDPIFTYADLKVPFDGNGNWYSTTGPFSMRINANGAVLEIDDSCSQFID